MLKFNKPKITIILKYTELHYQIALTLLNGVGAIKAKELAEKLDQLERLFVDSPLVLQSKTDFPKAFISKMGRKKALEKSISVAESLKNHRIESTFYNDNDFPHRLKNCVDSPVLLFRKGILNLNPQKIISIVGTRSATNYGKEICSEFIASIQGKGISVVSGMAHGIDAMIHRLCLKYDVPTVGVMGHGLDRVYPAVHRELASKMILNNCLLSEFIPGVMPDRENFPKRNRIVAGMSDATIVIESKKRGGSLITANLANDYNRDVFAYPGSVHMETSQGCNYLIAGQKAHLIQSSEEFLKFMSWEQSKNLPKTVQKSLFIQLSNLQKSIVDCIQENNTIQIDLLSIQLEMPISKLNQELFHLEMKSIVRSLPGKVYMVA